jgi:hypothetical protein
MDKLSKEQLIAIRKIVDGMTENIAHLMGGFEALRLLYPEFFNSSEVSYMQNQFMQVAKHPYGAFILMNLSESLRQEIEKRKKVE